MNANMIAVAAGGLLLLTSSTALAQTGVLAARDKFGFAPGYRAGYHASTAVEGALRGVAAGIQAVGEYNYNTAQALIALEHARALALENRLLYVETYFRAKELNRRYRFGDRSRMSPADATRYAKDALPDRLSPYQLDPVFGTIQWPITFDREEFAAQRTMVEELFRDRDIANSGLGTRNQLAIERQTDMMQQQLKGLIADLRPSDYIRAQNFLRSLAYEARFAPSVQGIVTR